MDAYKKAEEKREKALKRGHRVLNEWREVIKSYDSSNGYDNKQIAIPLTNTRADGKSLRLLTQSFGRELFNEDMNVCTLIHDKGQAVRAYVEPAEHGLYTDVIPLELDGWEQALPKLHEKQELFNYLKHVTERKTGITIGMIRPASIRFFNDLAKINEADNTLESVCNMYDFAHKTISRGDIYTFPEPRWMEFIRKSSPEFSVDSMKFLLESAIPDTSIGILVKTANGVVPLYVVKEEGDLQIEFARDSLEYITEGKTQDKNLQQLASEFRDRMQLRFTVAVTDEALKKAGSVISSMDTSNMKKLSDIIDSFSDIEHGKDYAMSPQVYHVAKPIVKQISARIPINKQYLLVLKDGIKKGSNITVSIDLKKGIIESPHRYSPHEKPLRIPINLKLFKRAVNYGIDAMNKWPVKVGKGIYARYMKRIFNKK